MSKQAKLPKGALEDAIHSWDVESDADHLEAAMRDALLAALPAILAQRDEEWRSALLGDEARRAVARVFWPKENVPADDKLEDVARALTAALNKAAPDGGGDK